MIHSAIHDARRDLNALIHIHSREGMAVASSVDKLLPVCQDSVFLEPISYHNFHGIVVGEGEKKALAKDFVAPSKCLMMRNHGLLTGGRTLEEAFLLMYYLHSVCKVYVDAGYTHRTVPSEMVIPDAVIDASMEAVAVNIKTSSFGKMDFESLARQLDYAGLETGYPYQH